MKTRTLYDWFLGSVQAHPDAVALEVSSISLTYGELLVAVERTSAVMYRAAGGAPARVGILASRSLVSCLAYLAAQRLGATVVPLNPTNPAARNLVMSSAAGVELTIVDDTSGDGLAEYQHDTDAAILDMRGDRWQALLYPADGEPPAVVQRDANDCAYIIFTSGTTGRPKGVPITHANVSSFLEAVIPKWGFGPGARVAQTLELAFDGSVLAMFGAWGSGATLCVAQRRDVLTPVKFVNAERLTHWVSVPSMISFAKRLRALAPDSMPTLRHSSFGGEPLTLDQADAWFAAAPNSAILNCYGPTETTVIVTGYEVPRDSEARIDTSNASLPIGDLYPQLEYALLDADLRPSDDGELCVRGGQRFPGYLDPAENAGRFVSFDHVQGRVYDGDRPLTAEHWYRTGDRIRKEHGQLVHVGRIDTQVKLSGYRVELAEIEGALRRHPAIVEAVAITVPAADGEVDLHAVYTGDRVEEDDVARLFDALPVYMRPRYVHHREDIPLSNDAKIDRRRLVEELHAGAPGRG
jgi:amino acid adenylation domain-containing protein